MFASLIFYFMFPQQVHGPPPFSNAVMVYQPINSWPLTYSFTTTWEGCPDCQAAYELGLREAPVTADFNRDGTIDSNDFYAYLAVYWATANGGQR